MKVELEEEETIEVGEITGGGEAITEMTDIMIVDRHLLVDIMTEVTIGMISMIEIIMVHQDTERIATMIITTEIEILEITESIGIGIMRIGIEAKTGTEMGIGIEMIDMTGLPETTMTDTMTEDMIGIHHLIIIQVAVVAHLALGLLHTEDQIIEVYFNCFMYPY